MIFAKVAEKASIIKNKHLINRNVKELLYIDKNIYKMPSTNIILNWKTSSIFKIKTDRSMHIITTCVQQCTKGSSQCNRITKRQWRHKNWL